MWLQAKQEHCWCSVQPAPFVQWGLRQRPESAHLYAGPDQSLSRSGQGGWPGRSCAAEVHSQSMLLSSGALHTHHSAVVRSGVDSAPVDTSDGLQQGCVLASNRSTGCTVRALNRKVTSMYHHYVRTRQAWNGKSTTLML
jgi:hypothetical protein